MENPEPGIEPNIGPNTDPNIEIDGQRRLHAMRFLVAPDEQAREAARQIAAGGGWRPVFDLCGQWKLLAALEARLGALRIALPQAERAELAQRTQPAFVQTMLCVRAGAMALSALERAGIVCAGFKGLAALAYLYPSLRSRTLQDTDVLIHPRSLKAALTVLEAAGFERSLDYPLEEYVAFLRNSPGAAGNEAISLRDDKGGAVDLHWHLGILDVETLLDGAAPVTMLNQPLPLMRAGHAMLLSAHHALRNDFVPGDIARDVCDFAHWQNLLNATGQWPAIAAGAERWGLAAACAALARIVAELKGLPQAEPPLPLRRADRAAARRLAGFYFHQLRSGAVNTDLAYVASARPLLQIAAGLGGGWTRYREFMRRSEQSNGEPSLSLRARLWSLGKALVSLSPQQWLQVRALAQAKDRVIHSQRPPSE